MTAQETEWYKYLPKYVKKRVDEYSPDKMYRYAQYIVPIYAYEQKDGKCDTCSVRILHVNNPGVQKDAIVSHVDFEDLEVISNDMARKR